MSQVKPALGFASALSTEPSAAHAAKDILQQLRSRLSSNADLVIAFVTSEHRRDLSILREQLCKELGAKHFLAATAQGVIGMKSELETHPGISVLAASIPGVGLHPFCLADMDNATMADPAALRRALLGDIPRIKGVILLADPFSTPIAQWLPLLTTALDGAPICGGMASAARKPGGNTLVLNERIRHDSAIGIAITGHVSVHTTVSQGCRPIGKPMVITRSQRHVIKELGGQNAMQAIQSMVEQLGEEDRDILREQPLMVGRVIDEYKDSFGRGDFLIRHVMGVDREAGYVAIGDPQVRTGQTVQFHVRDPKTAVEDFALLLEAQKLHAMDKADAAGALLFSCNGRGTNLFPEPHTDANLVGQAMGDLPLAGFFAAGEIGPVGQQAFLHGHTASLMVIRPQA